MNRLQRVLCAATVTAGLVACGDLSAPRRPEALTPPSASVTGEMAFAHVLRHDAAAPALESYEVSFWAIRGTSRSVELRYQNGKPNGGSGDRFLRFTVPSGALVTGPDGSRLRMKDSVLITLRLDATDFQVDFEPSGLSFARNTPAQLDIWYGQADPDVNHDGLVDATDALICNTLLGMYHYDKKGTSVWTPVSAANDVGSKTISGVVNGFSGYAVSW